MFGLLPAQGVIEVKCRSSRCGAAPGVIVLHRFSVHTGQLQETKKYRDPMQSKED